MGWFSFYFLGVLATWRLGGLLPTGPNQLRFLSSAFQLSKLIYSHIKPRAKGLSRCKTLKSWVSSISDVPTTLRQKKRKMVCCFTTQKTSSHMPSAWA